MAYEPARQGVYYNPKVGRIVHHEHYATRIFWNTQMLDCLRRHFPTTLNDVLARQYMALTLADCQYDSGHESEYFCETLRAFGFVKKEEWDGFLDDDNAWEFTADGLSFDEGSPFALSWLEEEDGCRRYKVLTRGYGEYPSLPHDAISDMQHFFYDFTHGNVLPIECNEKE